MGISLNSIKSALHNIAIENAAGDALLIDASGHISINDGGNTLTIDGTLTGITNDVNIADGGNVISIDDAGGSITVDGAVTVSATDLDIRDLTHVAGKDSVQVGDGTEILLINADGSINTLSNAGGLDSWQTSVVSATSTAGEIAATPLASRLRMEVQNLGSQDCYLGESNAVTTVNGILLPKGSSAELLLGAVSNLWAITASGTADLRVAEFAA